MANKLLHPEIFQARLEVENIDCIEIRHSQDGASKPHSREDKVEVLEVDSVKFVLRG